MTTATAITVTATPDLSIVDGQITTTSVQVAQHFNKRHRDVIRAINNLVRELPPEGMRNFAQGYYTMPETGDQQHKMYRITRDGFTLLAMGFTGKEALQWKLTYLQAFNRMEAELLKQANPNAIGYNRITPTQAQHLKELVQLVVESGKQNYGETWARLQRKFGVNSYLQLPEAKFTEACNYLKGKLDGDSIKSLIHKHIEPELQKLQPLPDADRLSLAFNMASQMAATAQQAVFAAIVNGQDPQWMYRRYLFGLDYDKNNQLKRVYTQPIPHEAAVMSMKDIAENIVKSGRSFISPDDLSMLAQACTQGLANMVSNRLN